MFGRKAREELLEVQKQLIKAQMDLELERANRSRVVEEVRTRAQEELNKYRERVHELEIANAVYKERLDLMTQMPQFSAQPSDLSMSEEREDLEDALKKGFIDDEQFKAELEAIGMLNPTVDFAPEFHRIGS